MPASFDEDAGATFRGGASTQLFEPAALPSSCPDPAHGGARPRPGAGWIRFARVDGATALVEARTASPLQILAPRPRGRNAWAVVLGHGGGLVAGDDIALDVEVGPAAAALVTTQAETKVYAARGGRGASQRVAARVGPGGVLAFLPDPLSPFAGSRCVQRMRFELSPGASLVAVDAVVAGRSARGERWRLDRYRSSLEVVREGRRVISDALLLAPGELGPQRPLHRRLGAFDGFASAIAVGPAFRDGAAALVARTAARPAEREARVLAAASPLADGAFLRCAATSAEALAEFLRGALAFAAASLEEDPFARRW